MNNSSDANTPQQHWQQLHSDYERYDRNALYIKLTAVLSSLIGLGLDIHLLIVTAVICILWLQEGIWRTFQARLSDHLIELENSGRQNDAPSFYSSWEEKRPGTIGLIKEYIRNSVRPTVAYPYVILIIVVLVLPVFI